MRFTLETHFAGNALKLDAAGAIYWPEAHALIVSDLHFEKASFLSQFGSMLPRYDTRATLQKLQELISHYRPVRVICLGDSFHDNHAYKRLEPEDRQALHALVKSVQHWHWVLGNHDTQIATDLPGHPHGSMKILNLLLTHEPENSDDAQIIGHYHPKLYAHVSGQRVSGPAFVKGSSHLIMPAFGSFTGGLDASDDAITSLVGECSHYLLYRDRLWKF